MTEDFSEYNKIINQFRGQVLKSDFEAKYATASSHMPKTERFLLKMELKRLAVTCIRLIDLRGHVEGECRPYEHEERIHYLDELAIRIFEESFEDYGAYTFGVYEAVMNTENNFRVMYQKEKLNLQEARIAKKPAPSKTFEKTQYPAQFYKIGAHHNRTEERMNFAIPVKIILDNQDELDAVSSDISVSGCKIRFNDETKFSIGQLLQLRFIGFEEEFQFDSDDGYQYKICNIQLMNDMRLVGLSRVISDEETAAANSFELFLKRYIQGNKRRYKVNMDNTVAAIKARSFEQFVLPKINELPVFVEEIQGALLPKYALTCINNQSIYQYWQDEKNKSTLNFLINSDRINKLKKLTENGQSLLVYSFIHKSQGKSFFYTADEEQLKGEQGLFQSFLGFAAAKNTFAITDLSLIKTESDKADASLTVSHFLSKQEQYINRPLTDDVRAILNNLPYVLVASDLSTIGLQNDYKRLTFENKYMAKLKTFGHKRLANPPVVNEVGINYKNQRAEPRFKYHTEVQVETEGVNWAGSSVDFSASGMQVELSKKAILIKGDIVSLSFPQLQKVTTLFDLSQLLYEIVKINKKRTIINLRVFVEKHQHIGRAFFKALIEKNIDKLTPDEYSLMIPGLSKGLRNIYSGSLTVPAIIVQTSGSRYKMDAVVSSAEHGRFLPYLRKLSNRKKYYNLYPLLNNPQMFNLINSSLKKMQGGDHPVTDVLYISIKSEYKSIEKSVNAKLESELESPNLKKDFVHNALQRGVFFCIQIKLSRTDEPDMDYLNPELSYISSYAIHRGKQIEQDIWSVAGIIQLFDITHEALVRHDIIPNIDDQELMSG
ncbi:MAG: PilZ domain-containing protein [Alteromonadaceae bacterium]|nr:PilZ domain-containing protein [Alteromonadaceae bacterium]